jgi:hypothetical protein
VRLTCGRERRRQEGGGRRRWGRAGAGASALGAGRTHVLYTAHRAHEQGRGLAGGGLVASRAPGWLRVTTRLCGGSAIEQA